MEHPTTIPTYREKPRVNSRHTVLTNVDDSVWLLVQCHYDHNTSLEQNSALSGYVASHDRVSACRTALIRYGRSAKGLKGHVALKAVDLGCLPSLAILVSRVTQFSVAAMLLGLVSRRITFPASAWSHTRA